MITTRTGIRIGSAYQRPAQRPDGDMLRLQLALIGHRPGMIERLLAVVKSIWR